MTSADEQHQEPGQDSGPTPSFRWARVLILGTALSALGGLWEQQAQLIKRTCFIAESVPPLSAIAAIVFLLLLRPALRAAGSKFGLSRGEILMTYAFVCVAVTVGFINLYRQAIGLLTSPLYLDDHNTTVQAVRPYLPEWLVPKDAEVIRWLWEGSPAGGVPWREWALPLFCLGGIFALFYFTTSLLIGLFHRRWSTDERLRFPVADLAVELVGEGTDSGLVSLLKSQGFWVGALIALFFNLCYIIPALNPDWTVPRVQLSLGFLWPDGPWRAGGHGPYLRLNPVVFGLGFLVPIDVLLTIWVTFFVLKIEAVIAFVLGAPYYPLFHIYEQQGLGGYLGLFLVMLWAIRRYLKDAFLDFFRKGNVSPNAPGKWTLVGLVTGISLLYMVLRATGMVPWFAALFLGLMLIRVIGMSRIRAQAGIPNIYLHIIDMTSFMWILGGGLLANAGAPTLAALVFMSFLVHCTFVTPYQADGFRLAEVTGVGYRRWVWLSLVAVVVGFVVATLFQLTAMYEYGFSKLGQAPSLWPANQVISTAKQGGPPETIRLVQMGVGGLTTMALAVMQRLYHWFPLNPVGFVVSCAIGRYIAIPMLIVWATKWSILKFGGGQAYKGLRKAGIGLAFTHLAIASLWGLLGLFDFPPTLRYVIGFW